MLEAFDRLALSVKLTAYHTKETAKYTERTGHEARLCAYHVNEHLKKCEQYSREN